MSTVCWGRGALVYTVLSLRINVYTDWFSGGMLTWQLRAHPELSADYSCHSTVFEGSQTWGWQLCTSMAWTGPGQPSLLSVPVFMGLILKKQDPGLQLHVLEAAYALHFQVGCVEWPLPFPASLWISPFTWHKDSGFD